MKKMKEIRFFLSISDIKSFIVTCICLMMLDLFVYDEKNKQNIKIELEKLNLETTCALKATYISSF